jgi:hypothetical protein
MNDLAGDPPPIACSLEAGEIQPRLAWIAALNARALRSLRRDDLAIHLTYAREAADEVRELIAKEQACCAFLSFDLQEDAQGLVLTLTAPEAAREAAELLFEPFAAKPLAAASSCGCCGAATAAD